MARHSAFAPKSEAHGCGLETPAPARWVALLIASAAALAVLSTAPAAASLSTAGLALLGKARARTSPAFEARRRQRCGRESCLSATRAGLRALPCRCAFPAPVLHRTP